MTHRIDLNKCGSNEPPEGFNATMLFQGLEALMQDDQDKLVERARGIYGCKVKNGPGGAEAYWVINAKVGKGTVEYNGKTKPDLTFVIDDADILDLVSGKLDPQKAFFQNKIKLQGNIGLAMKLLDVMRRAKGRIEEFRSKL